MLFLNLQEHILNSFRHFFIYFNELWSCPTKKLSIYKAKNFLWKEAISKLKFLNEKFTFNLVTKMGATELKINNWRFWCKKGVDRFLVDFHFFQDRVNIWQTGWLVWTWKVSFCNCFCWFALRFREITLNNVSKKLSFQSGIFRNESYEGVSALWG